MAIIIHAGEPGPAKDAFVYRLMCSLGVSGRTVFTDIPGYHKVCCSLPRVTVQQGGFWSFITVPRPIVVMDFADEYFRGWDRGAFDRSYAIVHKQHRLLGYDLFYLVRDVEALPVAIRRCAQQVVSNGWKWVG